MALSKLGKSFSELIEANRETHKDDTLRVPVGKIRPNRNQPRKSFNEAAIHELAQSLASHGILQPIVVTVSGDGYELVAGERRWRAAKHLGWETIPVRVLDVDEGGSLQAAIIENVQREDLNAIECAKGYRELMTRFGLTQMQLAQQLGKDRSSLANIIRLLELPQDIQDLVSTGAISMGHARALLAIPQDAERRVLAERVTKEGLSVRQVEELIPSGPRTTKARKAREADPNTKAAAQELAEVLGSRVSIRHGKGRGKIVIEYFSLDDFERIRRRIKGA